MMPSIDWLIYAAHAGFWGAFALTRSMTRASAAAADNGGVGETARRPVTARFSRAVLAVHVLAFGVMYLGIGAAVVSNRVPQAFVGQRALGAVLIAAGGALCCWAVAFFASWRYRAKLDVGHRLATGGPFRYLRHPIYMGLNLLALGSAVWVPTAVVWAAFGLMVVGSDLRARSEEKALARAFGSSYTAYCEHTRRFIPGIY